MAIKVSETTSIRKLVKKEPKLSRQVNQTFHRLSTTSSNDFGIQLNLPRFQEI